MNSLNNLLGVLKTCQKTRDRSERTLVPKYTSPPVWRCSPHLDMSHYATAVANILKIPEAHNLA
jgi:hypothetical protein